MEIDEHTKEDKNEEINGPTVESFSKHGREKLAEGMESVNSMVVVKASHSSLLKESKQVETVVLEVVGNPSGPSMQRRLKKKVCKDVSNNLEPGPKILKPAWNGSRGELE